MLIFYPAIFYREIDDSYSVVFPDLNHLATEGENFEDALKMAVDCLAGYIYSEKKDGNKIPPPSPLENIDVHCEDDEHDNYKSAFVNIVSVDVDLYAKKYFQSTVKKTLSIPKWLNDKAVAQNINFSKVFQSALMKELNI